MRRTVLVTGANSGIGRATVRHLAGLGFRCVGAVRSQEGLDALAEVATGADVEITPVLMDVTDSQACAQVVADHHLYAIVNNAGFFNAGMVEDVTDDEARHQLEAMVIAPMRLARLALPGMRDRGQGRIVNVSSAIVHANVTMTGWYQASKQALDALTTALRIETAAAGLDVVTIEPGAVDTDIWNKAAKDLQRRRETTIHPAAYDRSLALIEALHGHMRPPGAVAEAVGTALTTGQPRRRYRIGVDGTALRWATAVAPPAIRDRVLRAVLHL